ncbi:unnamed protein product [Orchesella dallaii]|uniref:Invertebrate defensins family profile domain-containing protein n=1 Tax=Orchesella dallaii TaxID=48710 RepID=A0ABP1Q7E5_9HEXA
MHTITMNRFVFLAIFTTIMITTVRCQYDNVEESEDREVRQAYNVPEDDFEESDGRLGRQAVPYAALEPNSKGCARARYKNEYCGGYGVHNWCDTICTTRGYPYSWCRPTYCVCHHGEDEGSYCQWTS